MKVTELYHLSRNLRKIMENRHITKKQLAKGAGISASTLSNWEKLECEPTLTHLKKLADFLDVSIDALVGRRN